MYAHLHKHMLFFSKEPGLFPVKDNAYGMVRTDVE